MRTTPSARPARPGPFRTPGTGWRCTAARARCCRRASCGADPGGSVWLHDAAGAREIAFARHRDTFEATLEAFAAAVAGRRNVTVRAMTQVGARSLSAQ